MSTTPPFSPEEEELLAAEFASGLLDPQEAAQAAARERSEPSFAAAVARWRNQLAELLEAEAGSEEAPGPEIWQAILARSGGGATLLGDDDLAALRRSRGRWRLAAAGMTAAAAVLLAMLLVRPQPVAVPAPAPASAQPGPLVALLDAGAARSLGAATYDVATHRLTIRLHNLRSGDRVPELWLIGADGQPRSLGVIVTPEAWSRTAPIVAGQPMAAGAKLAVSLEPTGGSPTGKPTGPVILSGELS